MKLSKRRNVVCAVLYDECDINSGAVYTRVMFWIWLRLQFTYWNFLPKQDMTKLHHIS